MAYVLIGIMFLIIVVLSFFMPGYFDSEYVEGVKIGYNIKLFLSFFPLLIWWSALVLPLKAENKIIELIHRIVIPIGLIINSVMIINIIKEILDPNKIRYVPFLVDMLYFSLWLLLFWKVLKLFKLFQKKSFEQT